MHELRALLLLSRLSRPLKSVLITDNGGSDVMFAVYVCLCLCHVLKVINIVDFNDYESKRHEADNNCCNFCTCAVCGALSLTVNPQKFFVDRSMGGSVA